MEKLFQSLTDLFGKVFNEPFINLTLMELLLSIALIALIVIIVYKVVKQILRFLKYMLMFIKTSIDATEKCKHIQCTNCGRTLDKCVCQKNKNKSNLARLILYKKEIKGKK